MSFPRYPKYKPSGVEWLGDVPEHWSVKPLKYLAGIDSCGSYGVEPDGAEFVLPVATTAQIDTAGQFAVERMPLRGFTPLEVQRYGCSAGDILVVKSSGSATNIISGKAGLVDELTPSFVFSNFLMRVRPDLRYGLPRFVYALLSSNLTRQRVELMCSTTTYPNLQIPNYTSASLPVPPLAEQTTIAEFLDRETGKIDELVAEQRRLMALLKEKRQAVISHAVTKGLNPHAPMKPSGIEWLGDVPVGWKVTNIKRVGRIQYGIGEPPKYYDDGTPLIRATNVHAGEIFSEGLVFVDPTEIPEKRIVWLQAGDIIVVRSGAYTGDSAIIPVGYGPCIAGFDMVLKCHSVNPEFVQFALLSKYLKDGQIDLQKMRAAQPHLNAEELGSCFFLLPPAKEQDEIVEFLGSELTKFDTLTTEAQRAIDLLQERRTALISAAVTGQMDVRNQPRN